MLYRLHGNINQAERMEVFHNFIDTKCGVLFCTVYIIIIIMIIIVIRMLLQEV